MNKKEIKNYCLSTYMDTIISRRKGRLTEYEDGRTKIINGMPHVWPVGISYYNVYIVCPYCRNFHWHGLGNVNYEGHRVSHCSGETQSEIENKGYYIEKE
jgi:hypothetical protein